MQIWQCFHPQVAYIEANDAAPLEMLGQTLIHGRRPFHALRSLRLGGNGLAQRRS